MSLKSILLDNQTFHAVFNKCQQMATLRMTLKTTYTETKTKQQLFWFLVLVFGFSLCNEQNTNCQLPLNTSKDKMSLKSNLKELKPTLFLISTIDQVKAREIFQSVALKKNKENDFQWCGGKKTSQKKSSQKKILRKKSSVNFKASHDFQVKSLQYIKGLN